jgi:periplasmic protein TonB
LKRFLVISIILHALVIAIALFLAPQKDKETKTMTAILVPPEAAQKPFEQPRPAEKKEKPKIRRQEPVRTGETGDPKKLFAVPKGKRASRGRTPSRESDNKAARSAQPRTKLSTPDKITGPSMHDRLFDSAAIGKTARAGKGKAMSVHNGGLSFDIGSERHYGWVQRFSEKVSTVWRYPPELLQRKIFSDVYVRITIARNGVLKRAELVRTSGYNSLDQSALKALKDANPYWPLPGDWEEDELTIVGRFYVP